jgi:coenzyme F420-reducing hydrogenase delta subunit
MRLSYPTDIKIVKVPCSGRVAIAHIMRALEMGADGAMVVGCLEGDCHFQTGNLRARRRVEFVQKILESIGMNPERVAMYNLSAGDGPRFADISREFDAKIKELGPSPIRTSKVKTSGKSIVEVAA